MARMGGSRGAYRWLMAPERAVVAGDPVRVGGVACAGATFVALASVDERGRISEGTVAGGDISEVDGDREAGRERHQNADAVALTA